MRKGKLNKETGELCCPKCGCTSLSTTKQGFGWIKGTVGTLAVGPVGAFAGGIGSRKVKVQCMHCGKKWMLKK